MKLSDLGVMDTVLRAACRFDNAGLPLGHVFLAKASF